MTTSAIGSKVFRLQTLTLHSGKSARIRAGLATRYLSAGEPEPRLSHDLLRGHIGWDRTADSPVLVVDGRPLSMIDLERILGTYEGWRVELRIVDATE